MIIRPLALTDLDGLIQMTIETFRPFYEDYVHPLYGDIVFEHQHPDWEQDYRDEMPALHEPTAGRHIAVAQVGHVVAGYVSWRTDHKPDHGERQLHVGPAHRGFARCGSATAPASADTGWGVTDVQGHGAEARSLGDLSLGKEPVGDSTLVEDLKGA